MAGEARHVADDCGGGKVSAPDHSGNAGMPGGRGAGSGRRPRAAPGHDVLARRRRPLHHASPGHHERPQNRCPQRGDVPSSGVGACAHGHALAATQGWCGTLEGNGGTGREDAGGDCPWRGSRVDLLGVGAAPSEPRRVYLRGVPPSQAGAAGPGGDERSPRAGRGGDRHRGLHRPGGAVGRRRPVRRPHRILLPG